MLAWRRDPAQRPTAKQALAHVWLAHGSSLERARGPPLDTTVVQRLQVARPCLTLAAGARLCPLRPRERCANAERGCVSCS